ncbi:hypothetical protein GETHLI_23950 [Geothrix limicola]|uniref:Outer membrane protein beta-barrel domain-containing protein n=1 Tax=Geothrix limicola TaxID=2927978 RepID=A0ABQ5QH51_9BACT|nr:hypothetical protein [Geothrix limicola]GLH73893.1 hypothetical protein GETHLI_23950 [Geothrix limicola]
MKRAALLIALSLPLVAQDQESYIGFRAHALVPMGDLIDLTNRQIGIGAAVFVSLPVNGGLVLRPLIGFQYIPKGDTLGLSGTKTTVGSVDFMMDGLWYPSEDPERGAYLIASIGGHQWHVASVGTSPSTINATRLGVNGGLGYQISPRLAFEARGFWSPIDKTLTATGLTLGATLRF